MGRVPERKRAGKRRLTGAKNRRAEVDFFAPPVYTNEVFQ